MNLHVRALENQDNGIWKELFAGYLLFYGTQLSGEQVELTWHRLQDPNFNSYGLVAEVEGIVVGITHYSFQDSTWAEKNYCYLEDLFVSPISRGMGAGRSLIDSVLEIARSAGSSRVFWNTDATNEAARKLYDTYVKASGKVQYRIQLK